ncbi:MAG: asparagine--tRNA ligase [Chitinophagales bacterium]|nr:MAG: asparagine--tRNA ligase [Chitinophagales bacterium]
MKTYISSLKQYIEQNVTLEGWVANKRTGKGIVFLILRDGTGFVQCVVSRQDVSAAIFADAEKLTLESSLNVSGKVVEDPKQEGGLELHVSSLSIYNIAEDYPIAKKEHGVEFLMDHRHLWLRSRRQWAIMRIRNRIMQSIHRFLQDRGFIQMDAPIFTENASEGTSTLFQTDFYGQPAYLSQSGQLYGEAMAFAQGLIYTFGPTFRAEKSKTRRHLSEFWMIEPEMCFYDNEMNMNLIEEMLRYLIRDTVKHCRPLLEIIGRDVSRLEKADAPFPRFTYDEAVSILKGEQQVNGLISYQILENDLRQIQEEIKAAKEEVQEREAKVKSGSLKKGELNFNINKIGQLKAEIKDLEERAQNIPQWIESARNFRYGNDFGGSDETVLTRLFDTPIMVYNWPYEVKAFYMKRDETGRFAKGVDVLAPEGFGEIVGGGERETNLDFLIHQIHTHGLPLQAFEWYLDLRRYGSVKHAGFGLGLERFIAYICGLHHVRETIPFPRMYGRLSP